MDEIAEDSSGTLSDPNYLPKQHDFYCYLSKWMDRKRVVDFSGACPL